MCQIYAQLDLNHRIAAITGKFLKPGLVSELEQNADTVCVRFWELMLKEAGVNNHAV